MTKTDTREKILTAASELVLHDGINQLTLEAVAQAAGLSKGGLLYHFPSKDALIKAMVEYYLNTFESRLTSETNESWLVAYLQASFHSDPQETRLASALLAAVALNPELLTPMQDYYRIWQEKAASNDPVLGTILRLVVDGLWISELLGLAPPDETLRTQILERLLVLAKDIKQ